MAADGHLQARVLRVLDGDTIDAAIGDRVERVRYIGIDAPEIGHEGKPGEPGGRVATRLNRRLVGGRAVRLELDVEARDRYGRLLAYVWVGDVMVNAELVRQGWARVLVIPPNLRHGALLQRLELEARQAPRGLWALPRRPGATSHRPGLSLRQS